MFGKQGSYLPGLTDSVARLTSVLYGRRYRCAMTAKERLRNLVEDLSEEEAAGALVIVERRRADPMLQALAAAPPDDEDSTPEEDSVTREALAAYERGEAISPVELKRDLGIAGACVSANGAFASRSTKRDG